MDFRHKVRLALKAIGHNDALAWAAQTPALPPVALAKSLSAGVSSAALEKFLAEAATESGQYDWFVRIQAVRRLNTYFPDGFGGANDQKFGIGAGWAMWASLFEPSQMDRAKQVWDAIVTTMKSNPSWCPQDPNDPRLLAAFADMTFAPTEAGRRLSAVMRRIEEIANVNNHPFRDARAIANFELAPRGFGWIYSAYLVDSQVCNGGFIQLYQNTGGAAVQVAVEAFRTIGCEALALVVEESLAAAQRWHATTLEDPLRTATAAIQGDQLPRPLDELDGEYFRLAREEGDHWLDKAMTKLVVSRPDLF